MMELIGAGPSCRWKPSSIRENDGVRVLVLRVGHVSVGLFDSVIVGEKRICFSMSAPVVNGCRFQDVAKLIRPQGHGMGDTWIEHLLAIDGVQVTFVVVSDRLS